MFFYWLGKFVIRFKWIIVVSWILAVGLIVLLAPSLSKVASSDQSSFLPDSSDAVQASKLIQQLYPGKDSGSSAILVFERKGGLKAEDIQYVVKLESYLRSQPELKVKDVASSFTNDKYKDSMLSKKNDAAFINVDLSVPGYKEITSAVIRDLRAITQKAGQPGAPVKPEGLTVNVTGDAAFGQEQIDNVQKSMEMTGTITVILVIIVLIIIYRSPIAFVIPLVTIGISFLASRGIVAALTNIGLQVSSFTQTFLIAVLFGAGTDYCLLMASRFREEIAGGKIPKEALKTSLGNSAVAIVSSGFTVIIGFAVMATAKFGLYKTTGPSIAIGVGITIIAVMTLTPALLAILGETMFWPAHPLKNPEKERLGSPFWNRLSQIVTSKPARFIIICLIIFIPFIVSNIGLKRTFDQLEELPSSSDAKQGFQVIKEHFSQGVLLPVKVVMKSEQSLWTNESLQVIDDIAKDILKVDGVVKVKTATRPLGEQMKGMLPKQIQMLSSAFSSVFYLPEGALDRYPDLKRAMEYYISPDGKGITFDIILDRSPYSAQALDTIKKIKDAVSFGIKHTPLDSSEFHLAGATASVSELRDITAEDFAKVVFFVLLGIFIVLALLLRSIIAPVYLILTILFSYATTMGITFLIFQAGLGKAGLSWSVPFFSFCILVALGVDYNIFLMARVKEEYVPGDVKGGIARALASTGKIITSCGIIMAGTFGAMIVSPVTQITQIGFATVIGLLIDTFIIRCLMVPSIAVKVGELNWWPGRKVKVLPYGKDGNVNM